MTETPLTAEPESGATYGLHPQPVWDQAREDYLAGESSTDICRRYGLSRSTFHARAARQGWRRRDQAPRTVSRFIDITGDIDDANFFDLSEMAILRLRQAILSGRSNEAAGWLALVRQLRDESIAHDPDPEWCANAEPAPSNLDSLDKLDSSIPSPGQPPNPP